MSFSSVSGKNWLFKSYDSSEINKFIDNYSLSEITAKLLSIRKNNIKDVDSFLNPKIKNYLPNPSILKDMDIAVNRTYESIIKDEKIGIFGDYDVDGASSTAVLVKYFSSINKKISTYIPDRQKEGYGPTVESFNKLISTGVKIIFTVDCGTLSYKPISLAQKLNIDVIVLDHHQSDTKLPNACAIVNPNRYDDKSELKYLCATGVCFIFLVALNKKLREEKWFLKNNVIEPNILNLLDLVSLGTVCDVVPLVDLNRAIVKQGLKILKNRTNLGLKTLYDLCKIESQPTTFDLGFKLGPRINAGGRVGKSSHGAELLISNDPEKAYKIALDLEKSNKERQSIEMLLTDEINNVVKKFDNHPVLVMSGESWHEGIIGIVASRIKDLHNKPTILISLKDGVGKGSARSILGFDIGAEIIKGVQSKILEKGGGHKMAGGFTIKQKNISIFRETLIKNFEKKFSNSSKDVNLYLDSVIAPSALNEKFLEEVNYLGPFGSGNTEPKFVIENLKVVTSNLAGKNHIISILSGKDGTTFKSFLWNGKNTPLEPYLDKKYKKRINIAGRMKLNEWRGKKSVEFIIEDISLN
tara:strand:- start:1132 stop:2880 length:1749 start_codon:yes stop_codon:yes gene_type:complete